MLRRRKELVWPREQKRGMPEGIGGRRKLFMFPCTDIIFMQLEEEKWEGLKSSFGLTPQKVEHFHGGDPF